MRERTQHSATLGPTSRREPPCPIERDWLAVKAGNLRTALTRSLSHSGEAGTGARLAVALWRFWEMRGETVEGLCRGEVYVAL